MKALYVTHPQVVIDPDVPTPRWGLNDKGTARAQAFAARGVVPRDAMIFASDETKATDLAGAIAAAVGAAGWKTREEALRLVSNPMDTRRLPDRTPIDFGLLYDDVAIVTPDGLRLVAWYVPTANGAVVIAQQCSERRDPHP